MFYSEKEFESFNNTIMKVKDINKELDMKLDKLKLEESGDIDIELEEEEEKYRSGIEKINEMIQRV